MKVIEIIVSPEGKSKLETRGFQGSECQEGSRFLELALGKQTSCSTTSEFHQTVPRNHTKLEQND